VIGAPAKRAEVGAAAGKAERLGAKTAGDTRTAMRQKESEVQQQGKTGAL
jgi:hypothetical protein